MSGSSAPPAAEVVPRLAVRDPDAWLRFAAWAVVMFSALQILAFSFGRDQGIYAVVGEGLLKGKIPYRDLWDFKPPGIFFIYGLAQGLFGKTMLAPRLLEVFGLVGMVVAFGRLGNTFFESRTAGYVGGAVASLIHAQLDFWHTGQPETFGGFLTAFALLVTATEFSKKKKAWAFLLVGALFSAAFLLKPPLGGGAIVCAAYLAKREQLMSGKRVDVWRPVIAMVVGGALLLLLCGAWFALRGGMPALRWTLGKFTPGYTALGWADRSAPGMLYWTLQETFTKYSALAAAGVIAAISMSPIHNREREGMFLVFGIMALQITGIAMQGKFFAYHYGATLPFVAFIAGLGLYKLWRRCLGGGLSGVAAFAAFVVACVMMRQAAGDLPQDFWERARARWLYTLRQEPFASREDLDRGLYYVADYNLGADRDVAALVRSRTTPADAIYIWGFEPCIYWLADRQPASRFIYDVPQRTQWEQAYARRELMNDLKRTPPALVIVQHNDVFPMVTGKASDSNADLQSFPELRDWVEAHYEPIKSIEDFDVFERR